MGMFDHVKFKTKCPDCGSTLDDFQSKSGPCELRTIPANKLDCFYDFCDCGLQITFNRPFGKKRWRRTVRNPITNNSIAYYYFDKKFSKRQIKKRTKS